MLRHIEKERNISRYLILAGIVSFILLELTMLADVYTSYVKYGKWISNTDGLISNLTKEFSDLFFLRT